MGDDGYDFMDAEAERAQRVMPEDFEWDGDLVGQVVSSTTAPVEPENHVEPAEPKKPPFNYATCVEIANFVVEEFVTDPLRLRTISDAMIQLGVYSGPSARTFAELKYGEVVVYRLKTKEELGE